MHAAPGNPGMEAVATRHDVDPLDGDGGRGAGHRDRRGPRRDRPRGAARGGRGRRRTRRRHRLLRPERARPRSSRAPRRSPSRSWPRAEVPTALAHVCETAEQVGRRAGRVRPAVRRQGRRAGGRQGRRRHRRPAGSRSTMPPRATASSSRSSSTDRRCRCSRSPTATPCCRCSRPRTSSASLDDDEGPNTGGMGAYTPLPWAPDDLVAEVTRRVLVPTVDEMARRGTPFQGLLYAGLALTSRGVRVVEFNARFGDPETQSLLALLDTPLSSLLHGAATGHPRRRRPAAVEGRGRRHGRHRLRELPRDAAHRRRRSTGIEVAERSTASTSSMPAPRATPRDGW